MNFWPCVNPGADLKLFLLPAFVEFKPSNPLSGAISPHLASVQLKILSLNYSTLQACSG